MENQNNIIFQVYNNYSSSIVLNQPKKLNSLDTDMLTKISKIIGEIENEPDLKVVFLEGEGSAFCAGGDIKELYTNITTGTPGKALDFYKLELDIDYGLPKIKPILFSIWNGYVMGGGAGLSVNAPIRIATENTIFAMPETNIGLFPDVGARYFLPHCMNGEYEIALYCGLIGKRIIGRLAAQCGIATHYVLTQNLAKFKQAIIDQSYNLNTIDEVKEVIKQHCEFQYEPLVFEFPNADLIRDVFKLDSLEAIFCRLEDKCKSTDEEEADFAKESIEMLKKMSPISLIIFFEGLKRARTYTSIKEAYDLDYKIYEK
jgi:3-hydroxyisobutyryl-CoA hydrolase